MNYDEFRALRESGLIRAGIDQSVALRLVDHLPARFQAAHIFWSWVWMLSIPAFICVSIFWKWWVGLLLLFVVTPMISRATKQSAAQFVLEHATESREFFELLEQNNLLIFHD